MSQSTEKKRKIGENKRDWEKAGEISQLFGTLSDEYRGLCHECGRAEPIDLDRDAFSSARKIRSIVP